MFSLGSSSFKHFLEPQLGLQLCGKVCFIIKFETGLPVTVDYNVLCAFFKLNLFCKR